MAYQWKPLMDYSWGYNEIMMGIPNPNIFSIKMTPPCLFLGNENGVNVLKVKPQAASMDGMWDC